MPRSRLASLTLPPVCSSAAGRTEMAGKELLVYGIGRESYGRSDRKVSAGWAIQG
jgi:hypothetical protein